MASYNLIVTLIGLSFFYFMNNSGAITVDFDASLFVSNGFMLEGHLCWSSKAADTVECARLCLRRSQCGSFNYDTQTGHCELNTQIASDALPLTVAKNAAYSEMSWWPSQIDPHCHGRPCLANETCISGGLSGGSCCSFTCFKLYPVIPPCPAGWIFFENHCYFFGVDDKTYTNARNWCAQESSTLVQVDSVAENNFLKETMRRMPAPAQGYWNDLYEVTTNGAERWRTTNDTLDPNVADWTSSNPDDTGGKRQRCTIFHQSVDYKWLDFECEDNANRRGRAMCEKTMV